MQTPAVEGSHRHLLQQRGHGATKSKRPLGRSYETGGRSRCQLEPLRVGREMGGDTPSNLLQEPQIGHNLPEDN